MTGLDRSSPRIVILGASGLIGEATATELLRQGFAVVPMARRFSRSQLAAFGAAAVQSWLVDLSTTALRKLLAERKADIVVNCIGVLQDSSRGHPDGVHRGFVERLLSALGSAENPALLIHLSIPGRVEDDRTSFSRSKREADRAIEAGSAPFIILRPGFVVAPTAYGGSALIRALAAAPLGLPAHEVAQPLAATDVVDIARTTAVVAFRWQQGERGWAAVWDVMARPKTTVGDVIAAFRHRLGQPDPRITMPSWYLDVGARAGDLAGRLGWSPPIRTTALREMRRGVEGDPNPWVTATGLQPGSLESVLARLPSTIQEKWFARLYLAKALILASLVLFWAISGLIALTVAFSPAAAILTSHGFAPALARAVTAGSSLLDLSIGIVIAFRKSCRIGLLTGIGVSLFYMTSATIITPELWVEPLGALVKTGPAIVLMLVALLTLDDR